MNRSLLNLTIDLLAAACLLVMVATGYILRFPLPSGTNRTHKLWEMSRHEWGTVHSWASAGFLAVLCIHVVLHWEWLFATIHRRFAKTPAAPDAQFRAEVATIAVFMTAGGDFGRAAHIGGRERHTPLHPLRGTDEAAALPSDRPSGPQAVDFQRDVSPIFEASCINCHGPGKRSRLMAIVSGKVKNMRSADAHLLTPREIPLLKTWINADADWPGE